MNTSKKEKRLLSIERLKEVFSYDPSLGKFSRNIPLPTRNGRIDSPVGTITKCNTLRIVLDGITIMGHTLAWVLYYNSYPNGTIYFKNGNNLDFKIGNLTLDIKHRKKYTKSSISKRLDKEGLTQELAKELFDYDPISGILTRKVSRSGRGGSKGTIINCKTDTGYLCAKVGNRTYPVHRIAWIWYYGYNSENPLDHISRNRLDNSIANLREVSYQCNARNRSVRSDSSTGITGISWCERQQQWHVAICKDKGASRFVCYAEDFTEAVAHRLAAEDCLGWNSCDNNSSAYQYMQKYLKGEL